MNYSKIKPEDIAFLKNLLRERVLTEVPEIYCHDYTEDLKYCPEVVVFPENTEEVSKIVRYCYEKNIPITPAGARTGLSGGMLPVYGGILLSIEKMNKIIEIDTENLQMTVQPGVITQIIKEEAEKYNLYYPPDPSSMGSCTIAGNIAENAGGAHAVKYGVTKDYIMSLQAVLPTGEIIRTGSKCIKDVTGYNLTQLLVGSEGTLAIITEATLKLIPKPKYNILMLATFPDITSAAKTVNKIFLNGIIPSALEFMEKDAIDFAQNYLNLYEYDTSKIQSLLLIELDGNYNEILMQEAEVIYDVLEQNNVVEVLLAESSAQKERLWKIRRIIGEAVKMNSIYKEEDTVVPRAKLPELLNFIKQLEQKYNFKSVCYGHAGDGNIHVNILKQNLPDEFWEKNLDKIISELFKYVISLGGTISGEHGIGLVQKKYMGIKFSRAELELMKKIKRVFDPKNILNPGKIFE